MVTNLSRIHHQLKNASYLLYWAERLKRVFHIDIEHCEHFVGKVKIIASIKDSLIIKKILDHVEATEEILPLAYQLPEAKMPPLVHKL